MFYSLKKEHIPINEFNLTSHSLIDLYVQGGSLHIFVSEIAARRRYVSRLAYRWQCGLNSCFLESCNNIYYDSPNADWSMIY